MLLKKAREQLTKDYRAPEALVFMSCASSYLYHCRNDGCNVKYGAVELLFYQLGNSMYSFITSIVQN